MPNVLLTQKCVRSCPYCFADSYMAESGTGFLTWSDYVYVLDFYERHQIGTVSMLGGEPSIHPQVVEMCDYALQRGFDVRMFTSGVMADKTRGRLRELWQRHDGGGRRFYFIVNLNHPSGTPASEARSQAAFLEDAGPRASISFNIYRPDFDLDFAFEAIARYDLQSTIRLGLAHPIAQAKNSNAHVNPDQYRDVALNLARHFPKFDRNRVVPGFDCGFPICMFTDEQLGQLYQLQATFNWTCGPIFDIGPGLEIWPCFPLSHVRSRTLYDFDTIQQANEYLMHEVQGQRRSNLGIYLECDECRHRTRGLCGGGCVTYMLPGASS